MDRVNTAKLVYSLNGPVCVAKCSIQNGEQIKFQFNFQKLIDSNSDVVIMCGNENWVCVE